MLVRENVSMFLSNAFASFAAFLRRERSAFSSDPSPSSMATGKSNVNKL